MPIFGVIFLSCALVGCATHDNKRETSAHMSKYEVGLPALGSKSTDVEEAEVGLEEQARGKENDIHSADTVEKFNQTKILIPEQSSQLSITPVILLEQNYTIQLGLFERSRQATEFISMHQLSSDDAGIAEVIINGARKFLLAYGVYADKSQAIQISDQLSQRLSTPMQVLSLAEVEAMAKMAEIQN